MRLAARSRVGSDSVYDYITAEMSKAVKKQVLCIAPCYFAQSGSKDVRQRRRRHARRSQSTLGQRRARACKPRRSKRAECAAPRVRRAAKNRSLQKKKKKSQWWCLRLSSDSQKRAGGGGVPACARGLTGRHGKANCNVVPLTLSHNELDFAYSNLVVLQKIIDPTH